MHTLLWSPDLITADQMIPYWKLPSAESLPGISRPNNTIEWVLYFVFPSPIFFYIHWPMGGMLTWIVRGLRWNRLCLTSSLSQETTMTLCQLVSKQPWPFVSWPANTMTLCQLARKYQDPLSVSQQIPWPFVSWPANTMTLCQLASKYYDPLAVGQQTAVTLYQLKWKLKQERLLAF